jgi:hydrogenase nickel incorporation protein HypA/HybF
MHELSVSSAVVDTAIRHAAGRKVSVVRLKVGALRQVVPDSLDFYWDIVSRDTVCEGSELEQELIPARLACDDCDAEWNVELPAFRCPECQSAAVSVLTGNELQVESIEVEETACIA